MQADIFFIISISTGNQGLKINLNKCYLDVYCAFQCWWPKMSLASLFDDVPQLFC